MATILTVHGTFDSGPESGEKWWQRNSPFEQEIRKHIESKGDDALIWQPVIWDGLNSETSRRRTGLQLFNEMAALEAKGEPYSVIGHSHGGTATSSALMEAAKRKHPLDHLKSWITVGTPFIETKKERFLFSRLGLFGKSVFVALLCGFLIFLLTFGAAFYDQVVLNPASMEYNLPVTVLIYLTLLALFLVPFFLFYFFMKRVTDRKLHIYQKKTTDYAEERFQTRWFPMWHSSDEALQSLGALRTMKLDVFAKNFAVSPISLLSVLLVPAILLVLLPSATVATALHRSAVQSGYKSVYMPTAKDYKINCSGRREVAGPTPRLDLPCNGASYLWNLVFLTDASIVFSYIKPFRAELLDNAADRPTLTDGLISLAVFSIILVALALALTALVQIMARSLSSLLSRSLNPLTLDQIKSTAFGSDTISDKAVHASAWPMWLGVGHPPLPEALGKPMLAASDAAVAGQVPKFRDAVTAFGAAKSQEQKSDLLTEYLTWIELIHTTYFKNEQFAKLMAYSLVKTGAFRATEAFQQDPDHDIVASWYREIHDNEFSV